jgi:sugar lactone lactonase YvrE
MARPPLLQAAAIVGVIIVALPVVAMAGLLLLVNPAGGRDFRPEPWTPPTARQLASDITHPAAPTAFSDQPLFGPEDIAVDSEGRVYTGTRDGFIWRLTPEGRTERFAAVGGRPLGLRFLPDDILIVANHGIGLQQVDPDGEVSLLASAADGRPILFANDLDVSSDGTVYFSDSSHRYNNTTLGIRSPSYLFPDMIDGRASGRVLAHDLTSGETRVILDDLYFPNGIALSADERTLWIAESNRYRILALDLALSLPPTVVIDSLPGTPDNLNRADDGTMLLAFYNRVAVVDQFVLPNAIVREVIARLPTGMFVNEERPLAGSILALDPSGQPLALLTGLSPAPTTVVQHGDRWYLGALLGQPVRFVEASRRGQP